MARHRLTPESRLPIGLVPGYWDLPRPYTTHEAGARWKASGPQRILQYVGNHSPEAVGDSHGR